MPAIPTRAEVALPISTDTWNAISAPPKTPAAIVARLNAAVNAALREPDVRRRLHDLKTIIGGDAGPAEVAKFVETERRQWGELVRAAGLEPQWRLRRGGPDRVGGVGLWKTDPGIPRAPPPKPRGSPPARL